MIKFFINELTVEPVIVLASNARGVMVKFADGATMNVFNSDLANTREEAETLSRFMRLDARARI